MAYKSLGLAALLVTALRSVVADPKVAADNERQDNEIAQVRTGFASLTERLDAFVRDNGALDADQAETLTGMKAELEAMGLALAGPADDPADNGVIAEVQPANIEGEGGTVATSPAADAVVEAQTQEQEGGQGGGE